MRTMSRAFFVFLVVVSFAMPSVMVLGGQGLARASARPANAPPELVPLTELFGVAGVALEFNASATDPDGDGLTYTWDFGDRSPLAVGNPVSHSYSLAGKYTYSVSVDDGQGNIISGSSTAWTAFTLRLMWSGWNTFSLPLVGWGYKASTLPLNVGDVVASYDYVNRTYRTYTVGISPPYKDFPILPNIGYWAYVSSPRTMQIFGEVPTEKQVVDFRLTPGGGWVMFGFVGLKTHKASQIPAMYTGGIVGAVARYDPGLYRYLVWVIGGPPFTDFNIYPGDAVFLWLTGSGTLSYYP